jgi:geranylgeranyl diphosphate synthase type II
MAHDSPAPLPPPNERAAIAARIENALAEILERARSADCPPRLAEALRYAVFPGGARLRPQLAIAVARALGDPRPAVVDRASAALELLHCGSLVHDDLPCFDDADTRRGQPSVHRAFDEATALLVGDALIALSLSECAEAADPATAVQLVRAVAKGVSTTHGIIGGQAWEGEPRVAVADYHRMKTGALFEAAVRIGALSAGARPEPWVRLADALGQAYQAADDLWDALVDEATLGKPVRQDQTHARPSVVATLGVEGAKQRLRALLDAADAAVPQCPHPERIRGWIAGFRAKLWATIESPRATASSAP